MRTDPRTTEVYKVTDIINNQPDVLTAIVKSRLPNAPETKGHLGDLYIQQFDNAGKYVQVALRPPPSGEEVEIRIPIEPPLTSAMEVRPRMMQWRAIVRKKYGIRDDIAVPYFIRPPMFPFVVPLGGALLILIWLTYGWGQFHAYCVDKVGFYAGYNTIKYAGWFAAFMHLLAEPALMIWMMNRHATPLKAQLKWLAWNVAIGWGAVDEYYECILYERVRHVYKQTDVGDIGPRIKEEVEVTDDKKKQ